MLTGTVKESTHTIFLTLIASYGLLLPQKLTLPAADLILRSSRPGREPSLCQEVKISGHKHKQLNQPLHEFQQQ